jgi:hypothetical protein
MHFIEILTSLITTNHYDSGWTMMQTYGAFGFILVLTAFAAGSKSIDVAEREKPSVGFDHNGKNYGCGTPGVWFD